MEITLLICVILITISILVGTVYFVLTMIQIKQTTKEVEILTRKIDAASPLLNLMLFSSSIVSALMNKIANLFNEKKK